MYVLGALFFVLVSLHVCKCLPEVQTSDSKCYGTHGNLTELHLICPTGNIIAIKDLMVGAKKSSSGCPDIFEPELHNASCCQESADDCQFKLDATAFNSNYHTACNGETECTIRAERLVVAGRNCLNENEYLTVTSYMYIDYYCIPDSDIGKSCSADLSTLDSVLYLANSGFPSEISGGTTTDCTCSVESDDCSASINVHTLQRVLTGDTNVTCDQRLSIFDENNTNVISWTCDDNTLDVSMDTVSFSYITFRFSGNRTQNGGKYWLGFQALQSNLTLNCPAVTREHCVPSTPSTTSTITSTTTSTLSTTPSTSVTTSPSTVTTTLNSTAEQSTDDKEDVLMIVIPFVVVGFVLLLIIIFVCLCLFCHKKDKVSDMEDKRSLVNNGSIQDSNGAASNVQYMYLVDETKVPASTCEISKLESEPVNESDHVVSETEKDSDLESYISEDVHERTENYTEESESNDDSSASENDLEEVTEHHSNVHTDVSTDESNSEDENEPSEEDDHEQENENEDRFSNYSSTDSEDISLANEIVEENSIIQEESDKRSDISKNYSTLDSANTGDDPDRDIETAYDVENVQVEEEKNTNDTKLIKSEDLIETKADQTDIKEVESESFMNETEEPNYTEEKSMDSFDDSEEKEYHQADGALPEIDDTFSQSKDRESGQLELLNVMNDTKEPNHTVEKSQNAFDFNEEKEHQVDEVLPEIVDTFIESKDQESDPVVPSPVLVDDDDFSQSFIPVNMEQKKHKKKKKRMKSKDVISPESVDTVNDRNNVTHVLGEIENFPSESKIIKNVEQQKEDMPLVDVDYCTKEEKRKKRKRDKMKDRKLSPNAEEILEQNDETKLFSDKDSVNSLQNHVKNIYVKEALKESDDPPEARLEEDETSLKDTNHVVEVKEDDEYSVDERYSVTPGAIVVKVKPFKPKTRHEVVQNNVLKAFFAKEIDNDKRIRQLLKSRRKGKRKNRRVSRKTDQDA